MSHLEHVPPEQIPEVIRVATRMFEAESDEARERRSLIDAAAEMDIPQEYLERAAASVQARKAEAIRRRRRNARIAAASAAFVLASGAIWKVTHRPAPPPAVYTFTQTSDTTWSLNVSPGSTAALTFPLSAGHGQVAKIRVDSFKPMGAGEYFVNFDTNDTPKNLGGYRMLTFTARATGLGHVRVALENGNERWRSNVFSLTPEWREYQAPLNQLDHQSRAGTGTGWRTTGAGAPAAAGKISFKLGQYVNDAGSKGDVQIGQIRFE